MTSRARKLAASRWAVVAVLLAGVIVAGGRAETNAHAASPSPSSASSGATLTIDRFEPKVVRPGDTLSIAGTLHNTSGVDQRNVAVRLRASGERIATRYDLAKEASLTNPIGFAVAKGRDNVGSLDADAKAYWQINVPVDDLGLPSSPSMFGAYPLEIQAFSSGNDDDISAVLPTTLLWLPDHAQYTPTKVSWLWPIVDGVHRGLGPTFLNDDLATDLSPQGRLGKLLAIASEARLPLTYAVDPALVDEAAAMAESAPQTQLRPGEPSSPGASTLSETSTAKPGDDAATKSPTTPKPDETASRSPGATPAPSPAPYQVKSGSTTKPGVGASVAATWLTQLRSLATAKDAALIALPYGDADLTALDRAGLSKEIAIVRSMGRSLIGEELAPPSLPNVVWPVGGLIDPATLGDLASTMVDTVILNDQALRPRDPNAVGTPRTDLQTASGPVRVVLTDSVLNHLIANPGSVDGGPRVAEQRILAETMLITEQRPGVGSAIVIAPPRDVDPDAFLAAVLNDTANVPWLKPVQVGEVADEPSDHVARQPLNYPQSAKDAELAPSVFSNVDELRDRITAFDSVLGPDVTESFLDADTVAIARAESLWWRHDPDQARNILAAVGADLTAHANQVRISNPRLITMTSRKQKIPITVINNLPDAVTVQLRLSAVNAARLKVTAEPTLTVNGNGNRAEVLIEVEATTSGRFQVQAQLVTTGASAQPFGEPVLFDLNSTAYGAVAFAIAGGAAGLLFLLSGFRIVRRIRRRNSGPATDSAENPATQEQNTPS